MKKIISILAFCLLLTSCYTPVDDPTRFDVTGFEPLWNTFKTDANKYGINIHEDNLIVTIVYNLTPQCGCLALTQYTVPGKHQVYVSFDANWYWLHPETRETIFYHEMGHAFFHREHVTYFSLMNPDISGHGWPTDFIRKNELITELFHPRFQN